MASYVGKVLPKVGVNPSWKNRCTRVTVVHFQTKAEAVVPQSRNKSKPRQPQLSRKLREEFAKYKDQHPIISCKRVEFNFYKGMKYDKFEPVPLASQSWLHRASCGDYFSLYKHCPKRSDAVHFRNIQRKDRGIVLENGEQDDDDGRRNNSFESLGIRPEIEKALRGMEVTVPADIQVAAIPSVLRGNNTVISAHTGCGKTLAYLLPVVQQIIQFKERHMEETPTNEPLALIVTPTRELAAQISDVLDGLSKELPVSFKLLLGGTKIDRSLRKVDVLVGSLGAVWKHVALGAYKTKRLIHVVLDEADALVDDINYRTVIRLFQRILVLNKRKVNDVEDPYGSQLTLVSATIPTNLSRTFDSIVSVKDLERISTPSLHHVPEHVPQTFLRVGKTNKAKVLYDLVYPDYKRNVPVIIFSNKASTADWVSLQLNDSGIPCRNLTSNVPRSFRESVFKDFQKGEFSILSSTDIGATGLDTVQVEHVINFEFPLYMALYVHRVGRVGRIGSSPTSHVTSLVSHPREISLVHKIEMAVRTGGALENVNINTPGIIAHRHGDDRI